MKRVACVIGVKVGRDEAKERLKKFSSPQSGNISMNIPQVTWLAKAAECVAFSVHIFSIQRSCK